MKKKVLVWMLSVCMVLTMMPLPAFAVETGTEGEGKEITVAAGGSIQAAIDVAEDGDVIKLSNDTTENVTVTQKPDVKITIDGNNMTMKGSITVDGKSKAYETAGLTIKNVKFDATNITTEACINLGVSGDNNTRYTRNITVENCTFTGADKVKAAIKSYTGGDKNLKVIGCTVDNTMHSLLQADNITGVVIDGCTVNSKNGINLNSSENVEIKNSTVEVNGYAVRIGASSGGGSGKVELSNNTLKTDDSEGDAVIVLRGVASSLVDLDMAENIISGETHISGVAADTNINADANYWDGEEAPTVIGTPVKVDSYYPDESKDTLTIVGKTAKINENLYDSLDAAIDAAINGDTITLINDCSENVTVEQKPDVKITIDGNNKSFTGTITVDGKSAAYPTAGITIKNVNFDAANIADTCIMLGVSGDNNTRYTSNVTIENCTFTDTVGTKAKVGIKSYTGGDKNLAVIGCKATNMHSLLQIKNIEGVQISGCEVTKSKNGISVGVSSNVEISDTQIATDGYGIRADGASGADMTIEGCTVEAEQPVVVRKTTGDYELTVTSGTYTPIGEGKHGIVFTGGDDGATLVEPTGNVISNIDESVETKVYPISEYAVEVNGKGYVSLQKAIDAAGENDVVKVISDITLSDDITIEAGKVVTLDLNGKTISGTHGANYSMIHVLNGAELIVEDTSTEQNGKITCAAGGNNTGANIWVEGKLTLNSGTIEVTGTWNLGFAVDLRPNAWGTAYAVGASFIMNGGTVKSTDTAVRIASNSSDSHDELGVTFTMNNGTIESSWDAIFVQHLYKGDLDIKVIDGNVSGDNSAVRIYGDAGSDIDIAVEDGNFNGKFKVADAYADTDAIKISGGTYDTDVSAYLVEGFVLKINEDGTYGVIEKDDATDLPYLYTDTETGVTYYSNSKEALAEALGINAGNVGVNALYLEQQIEDLKAALKDAEDSSASEKAALEQQIEDLKAEIAELSKENKLAVPVAKASNIASTGKVKVTWSAVEGADEYALYRATSENGSYEKLSTITGTSYINTSANAGTDYYYKVKALSDDKNVNNSDMSEAVKITCDLARPAVKAANVASTGKNKLTWKKISGAEQYKVYRSTSKSGKYTLMKTVSGTSYINTSAVAGKAYYYKVVAVDKDNTAANSAYSVAVKRTCDLARPAVTATSPVKKQVKLTWKKVTGAKNYVVYRATSSNGKYIKIATTTKVSYTNKSLKSGKTYYYKVRAISKNSAANSAYSTVDKRKAR